MFGLTGNGATLDHLRAKFPDLEDGWLQVTGAPFEALTEAEARVPLRFEDAGALKERVQITDATARSVESRPARVGAASLRERARRSAKGVIVISSSAARFVRLPKLARWRSSGYLERDRRHADVRPGGRTAVSKGVTWR